VEEELQGFMFPHSIPHKCFRWGSCGKRGYVWQFSQKEIGEEGQKAESSRGQKSWTIASHYFSKMVGAISMVGISRICGSLPLSINWQCEFRTAESAR